MNETDLFAFEADFVDTLRCVPMAVRFKLDLAGVKLTLRQWSRLTPEDRFERLMAPCATPAEVGAYRAALQALVAERSGETARDLPPGVTVAWQAMARTPDQVIGFARQAGVAPPSDTVWAGLTDLQRFVLLKLSRDNHDNVNFVPAMREFGLVS
ncbi:nitrate reductase associated protein [Caulobacter sp. KR2-114]|uniref:nitrate reductase associated protein n=1 Tax=Caulobacter sp. KR2-114 TaxID=3400912 RepID=UPI003C0EF1EB